jgi:sugar phosphate isomerase/epimerase
MKIALSAISFHQTLFSQRIKQEDVPVLAAQLGFDAVELLDVLAVPLPAGAWTGMARRLWYMVKHNFPFLPHSPLRRVPKRYEATIAHPLREAAARANVKLIGWTVGTDLTVQGEALTVERAYWQRAIATAHLLGAEVLRIVTGGRKGDKSALPIAQKNLRELVAMADGLQVAIENHGGLSSEPDLLIALLNAVPAAGCCLDFGNFEPQIRQEAILKLVPYTLHVHAKSYAFDDQGAERTLPYDLFMNALSEVRYDGWFVIEYEGYGDPITGIKQTRRLLERQR